MTLEIIDLRQFEACELTPLLEAESQVWGASLRWDYTASARLISSCLEEKRLSGYALVNERQIRGYSFFFYEGEKGLIGNLFVAPDGPGLSQALLLLEHVIETLIETPGLRRVETQLPHFTFEELDPCFGARCFRGYRRRFMALSLPNQPPGALLSGGRPSRIAPRRLQLADDFLIAPWERKHDPEAAQLLYQTYHSHVDALINDQYSSMEGTRRLLENIVRHRGCGEYLPTVSRVAIHRSTQKLAGLLALTAVRPRTAHIPQVAVGKEFQGAGLGSALMQGSFDELARQGYREVTLTVTDLNAGAVRLYERLGFETFRTFGAFIWSRHA